MTLTQFSSEIKRRIFDQLRQGLPPSEGTFDEAVLKEAKTKGDPQMGSTTFSPNHLAIEFIYSSPGGASTVFTVTVPSPQRIVFLPVPKWVVESIWQGDIDGSYHFEADAQRLLAEFSDLLTPQANAALFGPKQATRRE